MLLWVHAILSCITLVPSGPPQHLVLPNFLPLFCDGLRALVEGWDILLIGFLIHGRMGHSDSIGFLIHGVYWGPLLLPRPAGEEPLSKRLSQHSDGAHRAPPLAPSPSLFYTDWPEGHPNRIPLGSGAAQAPPSHVCNGPIFLICFWGVLCSVLDLRCYVLAFWVLIHLDLYFIVPGSASHICCGSQGSPHFIGNGGIFQFLKSNFLEHRFQGKE